MKTVVLLLGVLASPATLLAQGLMADIGYTSRDGADVASYRLGYASHLTGPVWWQLHGILLKDNGGNPVERYGGGIELNAWRGRGGPYLAGGLDLGVENNGPDDMFASWSAGAGYDLPILPGLGLGTEIRWRGFLNGDPGGVQFSAGLSYRWGGGRSKEPGAAAGGPGSPTSTTALPAPNAASESAPAPSAMTAASRLRLDVVATAREVMGQPYKYGGRGDGGFDCSGLIQYAYGEHGVTVPRVSTDQALVGDVVSRSLDLLEPGDILTFSASPGGNKVSHVGLYMGNGRFIHSASSRGVSESRLSADDPNGAWWYVRWVGARRIIADQ